MAPAVCLLLARRFNEVWPVPDWTSRARCWIALAPALAVALLVTAADYRLANDARLAAHIVARRYSHRQDRLWFEGHWGFQYYVADCGALPLEETHPLLPAGRFLAVALDNSNVFPLVEQKFKLVQRIEIPVFPWLSTMSLANSSGFYAAQRGPLPYAVGPAPPDRYLILQARAPARARPA
jgi:hypothetical protein